MKNQRGISLIVVMLALVVISFAAVALLRSVDTATLITGNLAFKKAALASGDAAAEQAITWLSNNAASTILQSDSAGDGYYSTSADACDLTGSMTPNVASDNVNWTGGTAAANCNMVAEVVTPTGVATGFTVAYVINRLCNASGNPTALFALDGTTPMIWSKTSTGTSVGSTRTGTNYGNGALSGGSQIYYRITTRITGPRNTVRYIQTFVVL